jgi:hypothetical protein
LPELTSNFPPDPYLWSRWDSQACITTLDSWSLTFWVIYLKNLKTSCRKIFRICKIILNSLSQSGFNVSNLDRSRKLWIWKQEGIK